MTDSDVLVLGFGAAGASAAIGFVIVAAVRRRHARAVPADVAALRALEEARAAIDRVDAQRFSTQVSTAVRGYVELAFGVRAPRLTTEELLADLMTDGSRVAAHRAELGRFLEFCDLAKYARWSLSRAEMTGMLESAEIFVRATAQGAS
ncbi:MAG TPA: hypothetical protein VGG28_26575 [Kofleriaceae bacterium]